MEGLQIRVYTSYEVNAGSLHIKLNHMKCLENVRERCLNVYNVSSTMVSSENIPSTCSIFRDCISFTLVLRSGTNSYRCYSVDVITSKKLPFGWPGPFSRRHHALLESVGESALFTNANIHIVYAEWLSWIRKNMWSNSFVGILQLQQV